MGRKKNTVDETAVLISSLRRCCLCTGINGDYSVKLGQIAHLDQDSSNSQYENLAFLCLEHHSEYDSRSSQHKNYTIQETKSHRNTLYSFIEENPTINKKGTKPFSEINKSCVLLFDGADETALYEEEDLNHISEYSIRGECAIEDGNYGGTIFSINGEGYDPIIYLRYYPIDDDKFPGEAVLIVKDSDSNEREVKTQMLVSNMRWIKFDLSYSNGKLTLIINDQKVTYPIKIASSLYSVQIAGRGYNGSPVCDNLNCYFTYFKFVNCEKDDVIFNFIFEDGKTYFDSLPKSQNLRLINMEDLDFYRPNDVEVG